MVHEDKQEKVIKYKRRKVWKVMVAMLRPVKNRQKK